MRVDVARFIGHKRSRIVGLVATVVAALTLTVAAPAWAEETGTASVAPIGSGGSYVVTLKNTGTETINEFFFSTGENLATNVVPSPACSAGSSPIVYSITCHSTIGPGASTQMCYTGHELAESAGISVLLGNGSASSSHSPAVSSCPVPGFKSLGGGGSGHHKHKKHKHKKHKH
jgi:hypothetical protein